MRLPPARTEDLSEARTWGEAVVYDHLTDEAHWLSADALVVWDACRDGETREAVVARLKAKHGDKAADLVDGSLGELVARRLVVVKSPGVSRRWLVKRLSLAAAVAATLTAPPAMAQVTCIPSHRPCNPPRPCCSGQCDTAGTPPRCI